LTTSFCVCCPARCRPLRPCARRLCNGNFRCASGQRVGRGPEGDAPPGSAMSFAVDDNCCVCCPPASLAGCRSFVRRSCNDSFRCASGQRVGRGAERGAWPRLTMSFAFSARQLRLLDAGPLFGGPATTASGAVPNKGLGAGGGANSADHGDVFGGRRRSL
jgi:hypothetical protein